MSHLAAGTSKIRIGSGGVMLPNHAPLIVAEQFATLETLFPGRIDLGVGRAPGSNGQTVLAIRGQNPEHGNSQRTSCPFSTISRITADSRLVAYLAPTQRRFGYWDLDYMARGWRPNWVSLLRSPLISRHGICKRPFRSTVTISSHPPPRHALCDGRGVRLCCRHG